jgi:hypothetical protein
MGFWYRGDEAQIGEARPSSRSEFDCLRRSPEGAPVSHDVLGAGSASIDLEVPRNNVCGAPRGGPPSMLPCNLSSFDKFRVSGDGPAVQARYYEI